MKVWQWCLLFVALSALLTWLLRVYALRRNLIDLPGERRSHQVPTPRGGGMAIAACVALATLLSLRWHPFREAACTFLAGLALVAGVGWWDDHRPLSAKLRLAVHALAALCLGGSVAGISGDPLDGLVAAVVAIGLINVWNFMDGINGLATSQAMLAALCFAFAHGTPLAVQPLALALACACLGFLPFNFPRARIFLGDGGSGALGYVLAGLFASAWAGGAWSPLRWIYWLPMSVFLVDAGFTLMSRILSGQRWWEPHAQHVYQRLARRYGHAPVTLGYAVSSCVAIALFFWLQELLQPRWEAAGSIAWLLLASTTWLLLRKGLRDI